MENRKLRIGLVVDNPKRDLKGLLLVAKELLEKEDIIVMMLPMYHQRVDSRILQLDAVVINYARKNNKSLINEYVSLGVKVFVLDTEGGILSNDSTDSPENWAKMFKEDGFADLITGYFFWGEKLYEAFKSFSSMKHDKLRLSGCPRYDQAKLTEIREPRYFNHILVNTNFSAINPLYSSSREQEKSVFVSVGWPEEYVDALLQNLIKVHERFIDDIDFVSKSLSSEFFVIRHHPFESSEIYKQRFSDLDNVTIDGAGDIFDAIQGAKCVIHLNCGSSADALVIGVPSISLEYMNNSLLKRHAPLPSRISISAESREHLVSLVSNIDNVRQQQNLEKIYSEYVAGFFYLNDGKASERVATGLLEMIKEDPDLDVDKFARGGGLAPAGNLKRKILLLLSNILGGRRLGIIREALQPGRRTKAFGCEDVVRIISKVDMNIDVQVQYAQGGFFNLKSSSIMIYRK